MGNQKFTFTWTRIIERSPIVALIEGAESNDEECEWEEQELTVKAVFYPGLPGTWEDPPEPDDCEVASVTDADGNEVTDLTDEENQQISDAAWDHCQKHGGDYDDGYDYYHPEPDYYPECKYNF